MLAEEICTDMYVQQWKNNVLLIYIGISNDLDLNSEAPKWRTYKLHKKPELSFNCLQLCTIVQ